jgi:hypothetical protein
MRHPFRPEQRAEILRRKIESYRPNFVEGIDAGTVEDYRREIAKAEAELAMIPQRGLHPPETSVVAFGTGSFGSRRCHSQPRRFGSFYRVTFCRRQEAASRPSCTGPPPMTSSRSQPFSHGNSLVSKVTHCRYGQGIRVMSVPQNTRSGPKA